MYTAIHSKQFNKSFKKISKHKDFNGEILRKVIRELAQGKVLEPRHRDHALKGDMSGIRECHIQNDILLMYRKEKDILILLLVDIGTHSELFG